MDEITNIQNALTQHAQTKGGRRLYKQQSDAHKSELLQNDVRQKTAALYEGSLAGRVDFNDLGDVMQRTRKYLDACAQTGTFPSLMGLSAYGLGVSRRAVYKHLQNHQESPSAQFLDRVRDLIADTLTSAALTNNANPVMSIFVLKNGLGFSDAVQIEPIIATKSAEDYSEEEMRKRYMMEGDD